MRPSRSIILPPSDWRWYPFRAWEGGSVAVFAQSRDQAQVATKGGIRFTHFWRCLLYCWWHNRGRS